MTDNELIEYAKKARQSSYSPYSKFAVGAALVADDNQVFLGCNVENASYGLTNCAERTAIFKAVSEGKRQFKKLVIIGDTEGPISPCGACRQVINEFCAPDMPVLMVNMKGEVKHTSIAELLPYSFGPEDLS
ncbi:cytidine deaminase [Limnobaculum parvum]|uniref:Cytidine deaminase n=1 Tax=Limnobaculum parvum TaxID=2172103 RepID=A0A2Y9TYY4_9GAMM|nr:cytidine deaminase [Limnobaculum parvum]AWH88750.1 cytidine deaminase [Limnobaculum parvum]